MNLYRNQRYLPSFKTEIADQGCPLIVKENGHTFIIGLYITKYKNYFEPD